VLPFLLQVHSVDNRSSLTFFFCTPKKRNKKRAPLRLTAAKKHLSLYSLNGGANELAFPFCYPTRHLFYKATLRDRYFFAPPAAGGRFLSIPRALMGHLTWPTQPEYSFFAYFLFLRAHIFWVRGFPVIPFLLQVHSLNSCSPLTFFFCAPTYSGYGVCPYFLFYYRCIA